ncbi:hypothetical protein ACQKPX_05275 [Photobacterium sp. DNB23_23_1]|uniref:Uncharacterized protein n=1 Tax=Photobacterium pectinilyticum TaxID=2906793 RepID=A0ABT1N9K4_9GAMM|nr:hypothetical protein [Photobacterium sp. ZSDE20]MCQ1061232.1 hypothetical protein [Photobacterium sp. ZSDE20]MDD1829648.1 hypothetical protein [Photobacterium sp. ZSDE20]
MCRKHEARRSIAQYMAESGSNGNVEDLEVLLAELVREVECKRGTEFAQVMCETASLQLLR